MTQRKQRIVIVGAGFGGVYTYLGLHKTLHGSGLVDVTLINPQDRFTFIPMIHEVATGTLLPSSITQPIRTLPQCCIESFIEGKVTQVNLDTQEVVVSYEDLESTDRDNHIPAKNTQTISYDYLVLGIGSQTNYFGVPGGAEYALPLKTLDHAIRIKNTIIERFQEAAREDDIEVKRNLLRFVIVGGGPTGVELTGEIADMVSYELQKAFPELRDFVSLVIIDRGTQLVARAGEWFGKRIDTILHKKASVYIMHETSVEEVKEHGVETSKGFIDAGMVVWAAGVKARGLELISDKEIHRDVRTGRIKVTPELRVHHYPNTFVVGDMAWACDQETQEPYPMRAQFAVREGGVVAHNITASIRGTERKHFHFKEQGLIISVGKGGSLARIFGVHVSGIIGWFVYRTAYLLSIVGWRAKLRTALEWTLNLFLPRDISKL